MKNIKDFIVESKFNGHEYYVDGVNLVQDSVNIAEIWDDNTVAFSPDCGLNEKERIALLKKLSGGKNPTLNDSYYKGKRFTDGQIHNA